MLRRLARPFAALFALWFALVLGDPGVLHACPMHGGHHATAAAAAPDHGAHGSHQQTAPADDASALCTCVGHCSAAAATLPLPTAAIFSVPVHVAEAASLFDQPADDAPASPDLRLQFANGPPSV